MKDSILRIYDFDETIYDGNSTQDFFYYLIKKYKRNFFICPVLYILNFCFRMELINLPTYIEKTYKLLYYKDDIRLEILDFWDANGGKIKDFYYAQQTQNDIIISASPEALLRPIAKRLGVKYLVASKFNFEKGVFEGNMCIGKEKVERLNKLGIYTCDEFYTDSMIDAPMIRFSKEGYIVEGNDCFRIWKKD